MQSDRARNGKPATFAEQAFNLLHADILKAKLRPGEKMHVERLRETYGLGATPLREALSKLSSLDLVTAEGQRGFRVAPVSMANLLDITKTRAWIEGIALRAAIAGGDRSWEAEILAACDRIGGAKYKRTVAVYERLRAKAMILLLRHTALRISDVCTLRRDAITWDEECGRWRVFLRTQKSGEPVYLPLPEGLKLALEALPTTRLQWRVCKAYKPFAITSRLLHRPMIR